MTLSSLNLIYGQSFEDSLDRERMAKRSILDYQVKDLMSEKPLFVTPDDDVSQVLGKMMKHDLHELPIVEDGELLGMVSYSTLLKRGKVPLNTKVGSLLVRPPTVEEGNALPRLAEILMSSGYRAVPVTRDGTLVGVISRTDCVKAFAKSEEFQRLTVRDIMTPDPQTLSEEETVLAARELMTALDERAVPVVDKAGKVVGVVGLKDMVKALTHPREKSTRGDVAGERVPLDVEVKGIMSTPPITISPMEGAAEAARLMGEHHISSVVVVEGEIPVGVVTQVDLLEQAAALRARDEVLVEISGIDEGDWWTYEILYTVIGRGLRRIASIVRPTIMNVHVVTYRNRGDRSKYSIRCRLSTERTLFLARDYDWDPYMAMHKVMNQLERRIKREKDLKVVRRKGRRSEG